MTNSPAYLAKAANALASAMNDKRAWPADLYESAPRWIALMEQLGEITRWVTQGAVAVRDDASQLPSDQAQPLATTAARLTAALNAVTSERALIDRRWRTIAATSERIRAVLPGKKNQQETQVASAVHDAGELVRKAANQRLAADDVVTVLQQAGEVCQAMAGLAMRISVAVERRSDDHSDLAGITRSLRRSVHNAYRDAGEQFAAAEELADQITTRWPRRWPNLI